MVTSAADRIPQADAELIIDNIPVQAALVDKSGQIVAINAYWRRFAEENGLPSLSYGLGSNYLTLCQTASGPTSTEARVVAEGLDSVLCAKRDEFTVIYPCHSPTERRWFRLLISGIRSPYSPEPMGAVILHFNITPEMLAEERHTAQRIEAERRLSLIEQEMEQSSEQILKTLENMAPQPVLREPETDKKTRAAYQTMITTILAAEGETSDPDPIPDMALAIAQRLADGDATASDVSRLHAKAVKQAKHGASHGRARWIARECRLGLIYVLGHLANIYRAILVR